jgi:hypothetical protein
VPYFGTIMLEDETCSNTSKWTGEEQKSDIRSYALVVTQLKQKSHKRKHTRLNYNSRK